MSALDGAEEQQIRSRMTELERTRALHSMLINGINEAIQAASRQRSAHENAIDVIDTSIALMKVDLGIPRSEWSPRECMAYDQEKLRREAVGEEMPS